MQRKGKNARQIAEALPELAENPDIIAASNELDDLQDIALFAKSDGAKLLLAKRTDKAVSLLRQILMKTNEKHEHLELLGLLAKFNAEIELVADLKNAHKNAELMQDLVDEMIKQNS